MAIKFSELHLGNTIKTIGGFSFKALSKQSEPALEPTSALVYTLSDDGSYYIVGTGFTSLSSIESDTSGGNAGSGLDSTWSGGDLYIPNKYNGKPVLAIAPRSFANINNIVNVVIQDGITHIGHRAFQSDNDFNMISCILPKTLTYMGGDSGSVFYLRRGLTRIEIPNTTRLGAYTFYNCDNLISVELQNVEIIGIGALIYCRKIKSIIMPKVKTIRSEAFKGCSSCKLFDFRGVTEVPTLENFDVFNNTPELTKKIVVPDALYDTWKKATNWADGRNYIVFSIIKASEYEASL